MADKSFRDELCNLINCHSQENGSDTPDFILAEYLTDCLEAFDKVTKKRTEWYEPKPAPNQDRPLDLSSAHEIVKSWPDWKQKLAKQILSPSKPVIGQK